MVNDTSTDYVSVRVHVLHGEKVAERLSNGFLDISLRRDGYDSLHDVKTKIAQATGGCLDPDLIWLSFGPNARHMGRQFINDATVDEKTVRAGVGGWGRSGSGYKVTR